MKKETAIKRIQKAIKKELGGETQAVQDYIFEIIYNFFLSLEYDPEEEETSAENLRYAIRVNLEDEIFDLLREAREETNK